MRSNRKHRWNVILAGGEGTRLRPVTRLIAGDDRPKQFCSLLENRSLLAKTRERLDGIAPDDHTAFLLSQAHEPYFFDEVADVQPSRLFVQPSNKGTTTAIVYGLLRLFHLDEEAIVGFFPSDHDFRDPGAFTSTVESAFEEVQHHSGKIILVGAPAEQADGDYGWIEPGPAVAKSECGLCRVSRFWEKPPASVALCLFTQGCLLNTFVMVGHIRDFLRAVAIAVPNTLETLSSVAYEPAAHVPEGSLAELYELLAPGDFSRQVLASSTERLAVCRLSGAGWTDLGTPPRLFEARRRNQRAVAVARAW